MPDPFELRVNWINLVNGYSWSITRGGQNRRTPTDLFDEYNVTFVSVTQQFNTTTSMGRLTLNILLSFAQFEREIIGERIRDKKLATARLGKYIGCQPKMGLDVVDRKYVINQEEAKIVRRMFKLLIDKIIVGKSQVKAQVRTDGIASIVDELSPIGTKEAEPKPKRAKQKRLHH